ncbi:hypothetical protein J6TS2_49190 [Heyndrickxia sporothermodurans]|nr:hypothetical protein J6TS2_49190 [Heyndrickxia sporothermodurans]
MFKSIVGILIGIWLLYSCIRERCIITAIITLVLIIIIILSMTTELLNRIPFYINVTIIAILGIGLFVSYTLETNEK